LAIRQLAKHTQHSAELLCVPSIVKAITRPETRRRPFLADDARGNASGPADVACGEVAPYTRQNDRLPIGGFGGFRLPVRVFSDDPERDPTRRAEPPNLLEIHVVQLFKEPCPLGLCELRQEIRHERPWQFGNRNRLRRYHLDVS